MIAVKEKYIRITGIPIMALIMTFIMRDHAMDEPFWQKYLVSVLFTTAYWNGAFLIFMMYRNWFPNISQTVKRLSLTIVTLILFVFVCGVVMRLALGYMEFSELTNLSKIFEHKFKTFIAAVFVGSIYESAFFFEKWKDTIKQNEALKNQQIRTQFEVLQNQMSPHFLFNSLNTLTTLIAENQDIAIEFTEKLSEVYRYILQNKEKELIPLEEEISFSKSYIYLLQMRYPENLKVSYRIDEQSYDKHIAPLTIQMLLENCIKHNVISRSRPLEIEIYVENGQSIIVKNNLQKKKALEKSTKTGLTNIKKRYKYLGGREVDVIVTHNSFMVAVPLIEVIYNENEYAEAV
ncbi:MAG: histidine kinase [Bacteroidota bacterium]